jgi:hypothetical protein
MRSLPSWAKAIAIGACGLAIWGAGVSGALTPPDPEGLQTVGPGRAGEILLGDTVKALHKRKLIGRLRPGCELDPGQRVAPLRPPLEGLAIFSGLPKKRNKVASLLVEGGAETVKGIGIGSTPGQARKAYPKADYDPPPSKPFAEGFIWVNSSRHPQMTFIVDPKTRRITAIGVPAPNLCE